MVVSRNCVGGGGGGDGVGCTHSICSNSFQEEEVRLMR